ncbi:MAG: hypothetical protein PHH77_11870 [Victivallaceae bacterium]|nr:hypothetical protein [Victivallaceae bacterium]
MDIIKAGNKIKEFLNGQLGREAKIIKLLKTDDGWTGEAEVFEESSFIKSLGLPAKVQDRNIYEVLLSETLEVVGFQQKKDEDDQDKK